MRLSTCLAVLVVVGAAGAAGCRKKVVPPPAPLALRPVAEARKALVAEFVFPSLQRTSTSSGQVAQRLGLPFSGPDMLRTLGARAGLPQAALDRIDLAKAIAVTAVLTGQAPAAAGSTTPVFAFALKDRSPAGFDAFVAALGTVGQRVQDAVRLDRGDAGGPSTMWLVPRDGAVCAADQQDRLQAACALALAARKAHPEDVRATLVPDALARANGTTVAEAMAGLRRQIAAAQDSPGQGTASKAADASTGFFLDAIGDLTEVRLLLALDESKGLSSTVEGHPRVDSALARRLAARRPYSVDPALLSEPPPGAVFALGSLELYKELLQRMQPALFEPAAEKEKLEFQAAMDTLFAALAGPMSGRFDLAPGSKPGARLGYRYDLSYGLVPNANPKATLDAVHKLISGPWMKRWMENLGPGLKVKLQTSRQRGKSDTVVIRMSADLRTLPPELKGKTAGLPLLDGRPVEARAMVTRDRLLLSMGEDARVALEALADRTPATPAGDLALALGETQGDESFFYADLATLLRPAMALAVGQAEAGGAAPPMLAQVEEIAASLRLGMWGSHRGGSTLTLRWRLPMTTMESAGTAVRAFMGMRGAAQAQ